MRHHALAYFEISQANVKSARIIGTFAAAGLSQRPPTDALPPEYRAGLREAHSCFPTTWTAPIRDLVPVAEAGEHLCANADTRLLMNVDRRSMLKLDGHGKTLMRNLLAGPPTVSKNGQVVVVAIMVDVPRASA